MLNKGTTGTIFITSLVWRGPWLGIEPGTSRTFASTIPLGYRGGGSNVSNNDKNNSDNNNNDNNNDDDDKNGDNNDDK